jgi:glycerol uptake facilitator-like aquaporin
MSQYSLSRCLVSEFVGTGLLVATVVGSGVMAQTLAGGNTAVALLGNTLPTGAILVVLIAVFGPISGAHFNPAVSLIFLLMRELRPSTFLLYLAMQVLGGLVGTWIAHLMFDLPLLQLSQHARHSPGQVISETVATFGLLATILGCRRSHAEFLPVAVALYVVAGYWFTASTCFANPAVAIARSLTDTFSGIRPRDVPWFILAELAGAMLAGSLFRWLLRAKGGHADARLSAASNSSLPAPSKIGNTLSPSDVV